MNALLTLFMIAHPFVSDGCTGFPDGTVKDPVLWKECCFEHDLHYWAGGSHTSRDKTDLRLRECVREKGEPIIAQMMYLGVRIGGYNPRKIKDKQWGNAWEYPGYSKLLPEQVQEIRTELPKLSIPLDIEKRFMEMIEEDTK